MCQDGDWKESGQGLEVIWKVSGKYESMSMFGQF